MKHDGMLFFLYYLFIFGSAGPFLCVGFPLVVESRGYSLVEVHRLLIAVDFIVAKHRLSGA